MWSEEGSRPAGEGDGGVWHPPLLGATLQGAKVMGPLPVFHDLTLQVPHLLGHPWLSGEL